MVVAAVVAAGGLIWITQMTTPASVHPIVVLLVFGMLYVLVLAVLTFFIFWGSRLATKVFGRHHMVRPAGMTLAKAYLYGSVLAFAPVALLAMRSVGQQGIGDIFLVILFEVLACFYVWRRS